MENNKKEKRDKGKNNFFERKQNQHMIQKKLFPRIKKNSNLCECKTSKNKPNEYEQNLYSREKNVLRNFWQCKHGERFDLIVVF